MGIMYTDMRQIVSALGLGQNEIVSIIGCGGKTTLLWGLAGHFSSQRVLVTASAKIGLPRHNLCASITSASQVKHLSGGGLQTLCGPGLHLIGDMEAQPGYVKSMPMEQLRRVCAAFDKTFMESDGSRGLPLKGWAEHEPAIPPFATLSIGVATVWPIGRVLDNTLAHRPEIFCRISGAQPGQPVTARHVAAAVSHPQGLTAKMRGRKSILLNQIDSPQDLRQAENVISLLPGNFLRGINRIAAVSLKNGTARLLWAGD